MKILGLMLLLVGMAGILVGGNPPHPTPEIDTGSAGTAVALLAGTLLIFKSRLQK